ncbi:MAG TPA: DUF3891 family protein [Oceanipulchritudo sp.]|nr:DUF3891 family protein [Oceanipulchritudo sp.]
METDDGWLLVGHQDHARLAGEIGRLWGNDRFPAPEPLENVLLAVSRHDDAWAARDATPELAPDGTPAAFSKDLVGTYSAFENIDLEDYLKVRGEATEAVARENPLAAVLISMHTVNLLTEQADLSGLSSPDRALHADFVEAQRQRQEALKAEIPVSMRPSGEQLQRAFRFLQACDSLSLVACVAYPESIALRHRHLTKKGDEVSIFSHPEGVGTYRLDPSPLRENNCLFTVPALALKGKHFSSKNAFHKAIKEGNHQTVKITVRS